jgi:hypothetical protein
MSEWSHVICEDCFAKVAPDRVPVRLMLAEPEPCCWCGKVCPGDIIRREDPANLPNCTAREP